MSLLGPTAPAWAPTSPLVAVTLNPLHAPVAPLGDPYAPGPPKDVASFLNSDLCVCVCARGGMPY